MKKIVILLMVVAFAGVKCASKEKYKQGNWRSDMLSLSQSMSVLLRYAHDEEKFYNPSNESKIKQELKNIYETSTHVDQVKARPDDDPLLKYSSHKFSEDMKMTLNQFQAGNKRYAMYSVKNMSNYCVSCHTRTEHGRKNLNIDWLAGTKGMKASEKAQYYFSVREYVKGIEETEKALKSEEARDPGDWEALIYRSLAVSVRINESPKQTKSILVLLQKSKAPRYLKSFIPYWKKSINGWEKEKSRKKLSRKQIYEVAKKLMQKATSYEKYDYGLIEFLRASSLLHEVLQKDQKDFINAHSLYLSAEASKALKDINLWTASEIYYESCIRSWPQTKLAQKCYLELEDDLLDDDRILGKEDKAKINERLVTLQNLAYGIANAVDEQQRRYFEKMGERDGR